MSIELKDNLNGKIKSFHDLIVWQKGIELVQKIYEVTKKFPHEEQYALSLQMRRASVSVPSNIAEGFRRKHNREYKQFLNIALGSCAELETQVIIAAKLNYIDDEDKNFLIELLSYICKMIVNLNKRILI
ncbi:MAG: four helix bundle protein [Candidatus Omnitrophota bacterium]|jgi:four helix bundle protein